MTWARLNAPGPLRTLRTEVDQLLDSFFGAGQGYSGAGTPSYLGAARSAVANRRFPPLNVWEEGENLVAEAELPGLKAEDIEISVIGRDLTLKGRRGDADQEGTTYHRRERGVGEFVRVLRLPVEVDAEKVQATMQDGVLTITLPKSEAAKPRKIKVIAAG